MTRWILPPLAPYQGPACCPLCAGARVTGDRYEFDPAGSGEVLLCDVICPGCDGCGRADHDGCAPREHVGWPNDDQWIDLDDEDDADQDDECPSCHGRTWWACQGFTDTDVYHLRVACGCAKPLLIEADHD